MAAGTKAPGAFRTIGELAEELGIPQHRLRYWETRFPQLRPLTRAGQRRYYRPQDVALVRRIHQLLASQGYTIRGVQQLLEREEVPAAAAPARDAKEDATTAVLRSIRALLHEALVADSR